MRARPQSRGAHLRAGGAKRSGLAQGREPRLRAGERPHHAVGQRRGALGRRPRAAGLSGALDFLALILSENRFPLFGIMRYLSGGPMVTLSLPMPSTSHSILSPATVAATPDGVPVMMMSPASSATISESLEIVSGTFQIIWLRSPSWRTLPLTLSVILPLAGWPLSAAGLSGPQGAEWSNALPTSHGRLISREANCRSRRVRSMPTA